MAGPVTSPCWPCTTLLPLGKVSLSPVKKTTRLDIGKSGLPVDKGGHQGRRSVEIGTEIEELVDDAVTPFDRSLVGTYSCHGAEPTDTGSIAKINQDCASISHR